MKFEQLNEIACTKLVFIGRNNSNCGTLGKATQKLIKYVQKQLHARYCQKRAVQLKKATDWKLPDIQRIDKAV